jgi:hypothetical protein
VVQEIGYLLPDNPQPDGFRCVKVFIPDDDIYLLALAGSLHYLTKWVAWEKEPTGKAAIAANVWKAAMQYTYEYGWLNCGEDDLCNCEDELAAIEERLQELENMVVNVSCGGCGCSQQTQCIPVDQVAPPPGWLPPNPGQGIPTPEDDLGLLWKCNLAHYCAYLLRLWGIQATASNGVNLIMESVNATYAMLGYPAPSYGHQLVVSAVAQMLLTFATTDDVTVPFDANYDVVVCTLYSAPTDTDAINNVATLMTTIYQNTVGQAMATLASLLPTEAMFTPGDFGDLPPGYTDRDCSSCGSPIAPGVGIWYLVPERLATPYPTVDSPSAEIFAAAGVCKRGTTTDIQAWFRRDDYYFLEENNSVAAVAFTVTARESTPVPPAGNGFFYGAANHKTWLNDVNAGETVLIYHEDHPQADVGAFDHAFPVLNWGNLNTQFGFTWFTYQPPDTDIDFGVDDFEVRLVA